MAQETGNGRGRRGPRCIALVGPFQSGKTTLMEAILARMGALQRQGNVGAGTTIGDSSSEARSHGMSVEANVATIDFMGDSYTFVDCPGSIEFLNEMRPVLPAVDAAVVVCETDEKKVPALQLILRELEDQKIPRFLFLNKIDGAGQRVRDTIPLLQPASRVPLLLRQIPIWKDGIATRSMPPRASSRYPPTTSCARRRRAIRCWSACPTMTTSSSRSFSTRSSHRATVSSTIWRASCARASPSLC
jgi:elongation factor G